MTKQLVTIKVSAPGSDARALDDSLGRLRRAFKVIRESPTKHSRPDQVPWVFRFLDCELEAPDP